MMLKKYKRIGFICILVVLFMGIVEPVSAQKQKTKNTEIKHEDESFTPEKVLPEFPGGIDSLMKFISENIVYPEIAREHGLKGRVLVKFVVKPDGTVSDIEVIESVHFILDEEAIRVVKLMPKWKPGKLYGKTVPVTFQLPIMFTLD